MSSRAYRSVAVNDVEWERLGKEREGMAVWLGVDIGKRKVWVVCRWENGGFERPWRVDNPGEIPALLALVEKMRQGRSLVVAMESSGTYGDALRQALGDRRIDVHRVGNKAAHDYAEVFDGVPSQHDGKDAAVIAELAALGKAALWEYQPPSPWEGELSYWVERMVCHRQMLTLWQGRLEGLVSRHWPEATRVLKLSSATLLRALEHSGDPRTFAADPNAAKLLVRWGGAFLSREKVERLIAASAASVGVRVGQWQRQRIQEYAREALAARKEMNRAKRKLAALAEGHAVLQAQGKVVGVPTACVLWTSVGDPRLFDAAASYRKAMGLNLVERSSGQYQGKIRISKRGCSRVRQWLYFAALRLIRTSGVRPWYEAKKAQDKNDGQRSVVTVMRKLAKALHHVAVHDEEFDPRRLFAHIARPGASTAATTAKTRKARAFLE
jgi:transposase